MRFGIVSLLFCLVSICGCTSDDGCDSCNDDHYNDNGGVTVQPHINYTVVNYNGAVFRFGQSNLGGAINCTVMNQTNLPMNVTFYITLSNGYQSNTQFVGLDAFNSDIVYMGSTGALLQNNTLTMVVTAYNEAPQGNG